MPEDRFKVLVAHAPVCIHEIDLRGRLTAMNPAGLLMMGVDDEAEICGMPYLDAVGEADRPRIAKLLDQALRSGAAHFEFTSAGDHPRVFASNFIPVRDEDGQLLKLMGVTRDITEQRRAEQALVQSNRQLEQQVAARTAQLSSLNERLLARNAELDAFAQAISHDLKSPLATITAYASLLEQLATDTDQAQRLGHITDAAMRMASMIDELLELARLGEDTASAGSSAALDDVLDRVLGDLAEEIDRSGASVTRAPLPVVGGSQTQHHRILQNLIGNAIKFRGDARPEVRVAATQRDGMAVISVSDNGMGVPEAHHNAIFKVFSRVQVHPDRPGSGMGLAICKRLVEGLGGQLLVQSQPGHGSTFTYTVPVVG